MEEKMLIETGADIFNRITLEYENKTPNEIEKGEISVGNDCAASVLFPINARYAINLFFIEIGGILKQTHILLRVLKHLWNKKVTRETINSENTAFILCSPIMEEQPTHEDIRFQNKESIDASRDVFRDSYSEIVYSALDRIISMIIRPGNAEGILVKMSAQERIGIVFLISSELSIQLLDNYPFPKVIDGKDHTIMHANVISVRVTESSKQSLWDYTQKIRKEFDLINEVYYSRKDSAISFATIHDDKKEKRNEDESLLRG